MSKILPAVLAAFALAGCASYRWTSSVPADMRTVSVPTFTVRMSAGTEDVHL